MAETQGESQALARINAKLSALLAITVDRHLRDTGLAKPRPRTIDQLLQDAGLTVPEIAELLGKTPQAVYQIVGKTKKKSAKNGGAAPAGASATSGDGEPSR